MDCMGSEDLFRQSGVGFITEAWAAAKFAALRRAAHVRLIPQRDCWPDFELRAGNQVEQWEFTEADEPDRRRGDEYRTHSQRRAVGGPTVENDPVEDWIARAERVPTALCVAVRRKLQRRYSDSASLLIYLNIDEYGIRQNEIEASFQNATAKGKDAFTEIWILWKDRAYQVWRHGQPVVTPSSPKRESERNQ